MADYINETKKVAAHDRLRKLIKQIEPRQADGRMDKDFGYAQPRIVACLGPELKFGDADEEGDALLVRIGLRDALAQEQGLVIVERDVLEDVLTEMDLSTSSLFDEQARLEIGKLLPAGLLLVGDMLVVKEKGWLSLRLVDTETTGILDPFRHAFQENTDILELCDTMATNIARQIQLKKPLSARVFHCEDEFIQAGVGVFHGAYPDMRFVVTDIEPSVPGRQIKDDHILGTAVITATEEEQSSLHVTWRNPISVLPEQIWIVEDVNIPVVNELR